MARITVAWLNLHSDSICGGSSSEDLDGIAFATPRHALLLTMLQVDVRFPKHGSTMVHTKYKILEIDLISMIPLLSIHRTRSENQHVATLTSRKHRAPKTSGGSEHHFAYQTGHKLEMISPAFRLNHVHHSLVQSLCWWYLNSNCWWLNPHKIAGSLFITTWPTLDTLQKSHV